MPNRKTPINALFLSPTKKSEYVDLVSRERHVKPEDKPCPLCFGSGMEVVSGKGARPCECRRARSHSLLLKKAGIPKRYIDCHFQSYATKTRWQERAFSKAAKLAMKYPEVERGLLLMGPVGVGKTHLAVSALKALVERKYSCLFCEFGTLLKNIRASYTSTASEVEILSPAVDADILVLDEIGAPKSSDWTLDTLSYVVNSRYNDKKLTILTTNYLDANDSENTETLEDRIGVRLRSRLREMCETVLIKGPDYRKNFDNISS